LGFGALWAFRACVDTLSLQLPVRLSNVIRRTHSWLPWSIAIAAFVGYAAFFTYFTLGNHRHLQTSCFDLGLETNLVWGAMHGAPLFKSTPLGGSMMHGAFHQTYFAFVMGPLFLLYPKAEFLLVLQSILIGASVIPLFLLARRRLGAWLAAFISVLYVLYPPLHGSNLYDFHYTPLSTFFLLMTVYWVEVKRNWLALLTGLTCLTLREDVGLLLAVFGAYFLLEGRRIRPALVMTTLGLTCFLVLKFGIMPRFLGGHESFVNQYMKLAPEHDRTFGGVLKTIIANPGFTMSTLVTEPKLVYALKIFAPVLFLPLLRSRAWLLFGPGLFFTLLSTDYASLLMLSFQYTAYWNPFVFFGLVICLEHVLRQPRPSMMVDSELHRALPYVAALIFTMLPLSYRYGVVLQQNTAYGAWEKLSFGDTPTTQKRYADLRSLLERIPQDAKVTASEFLVPHIAGRDAAYGLRNDVLDSEYILVQRTLRSDERPRLTDVVRRRQFGILEQKGEFTLLKRGLPVENIPKTLRSLGLK